ncbi:15263_t:CDS:1 [Funneliformis geosporum]|uniref:GrpE protein homolog, mitochondrial n=1 Tax=Funneliformis geosporum TaxID=1117311 RepID=A0A9W4SAF1_9GLOM|nr:15263_t:CDS:1 [Funneliformis geosporum]
MNKKTESKLNNSEKTRKDSEKLTQQTEEKKQDIIEKEDSQKVTEQKPLETTDLKKEIEVLKDKNLRLLADLENQKKGFFQEMEKMTKMLKYNVSKELIEKVLPLFDSYDRAIKISQTYQDPKIKQFLVGFQMTFAESQNVFFEREGIEEIKITPKKDTYNRELHNPQQVEESNDYAEGTILEVLKKGYLYQKKVLRPAEVKVSKRRSEKNK